MSHKDAPPETAEQRRMREFYTARGVNCGWGRGKSGAYLAPFAADAWAAWQEAQRIPQPRRCPDCGRGDDRRHALGCPSAADRETAGHD